MRPAVFLLLAIILVSGCVAGGGPGVVIESFEPDFQEVSAGETTSFHIKVRNAGPVEAKGVQVTLLGLEEWSAASTTCVIGTLLEASPLGGTPGEVGLCTFTATAPAVPRGIPVRYTPTARVSYQYESSLLQSVTVGTQEELRKIEQGGGSLPAEILSASSGPVTLSAALKGPIRVFRNSFTFPVEITATNAGGGVACASSCAQNLAWDTLTVEVTLPPDEKCSRTLTLFQGETNTFTCFLSAEAPQSGILQKTLRAQSNYEYFSDKTTAVTVNPLPA